MINQIRQEYNENFDNFKYQNFLNHLHQAYNHKIPFRIGETPVFIDSILKNKLIEAGNDIIKSIKDVDFINKTHNAIPASCFVPGDENKPTFLAIDFGITKNQNGEIEPQLIELQGFPSLFAYQNFLANSYKTYFDIPDSYSHLINTDETSYLNTFKNIVLGNHKPEHVVLLEIEPYLQTTAIDFYCTESITGIKSICITEVIKEGKDLFYTNNGVKTPIKRIYNRIIFDELLRRTDLKYQFNLTDEVNVEWVCHPNWYFRISKYIMPQLKSNFVPECKFLADFESIPIDLENYVLKPLYSFSGNGIIFNVNENDINQIPDSEKHSYILQKKIQYEPIIPAMDGGLIKVEIRLLYFWEQENESPNLVINLCRLSRGEMIGVKYNKDKTWVGGSVGFMAC